MIRHGRGYRQVFIFVPALRRSPERYAKKWDRKIFSKRRDFREENISLLDDLLVLRADGNNLEVCLRDFESDVPSWKVKTILGFCQGVPSMSAEPTEKNQPEEELQAWLDDRDSLTKLSRAHSPWLGAHGLYAQLKLPRFGLDGQPDADRRLIYVRDLRPAHVSAIVESALSHQIGALREALWMHLALKSSLKVKISLIGFKTFCLEFHMPYLALRYSSTRLAGNSGKPMRKQIDLSFINIPKHANARHRTCVLQEAHISLSIIGVDHHIWTSYCFADTNLGSACPDDQSHEGRQEEAEGAEEERINEDPTISDGQIDEVLVADTPVWDPREYFLRIVDVRMRQIQREWGNVVHVVGESVANWTAAHSFVLSGNRRRHQSAEIQEALNDIVKILVLLRHLLGHLKTTIFVWQRFAAPCGDISYFSDIKQSHIRHRLDSIRAVFDELIVLNATLKELNSSCKIDQKTLEIQLNVEGNRLNHEGHALSLEASRSTKESHELGLKTVKLSHKNNKLATLALVMSQILVPVGIVVAAFGTQQEILHFERNPRSFVISVAVVTVSVNLIAWLISMVGHCNWPERLNHIVERIRPWRNELGRSDMDMTPGLPHHV